MSRIGTHALLFQTGYLTITHITGEQRLGGMALSRLGYPNREARASLNRVLLRHLVQDAAQQTANSIRLAHLLETHDWARHEGSVPCPLRRHSLSNGTRAATSPTTPSSRCGSAMRYSG